MVINVLDLAASIVYLVLLVILNTSFVYKSVEYIQTAVSSIIIIRFYDEV